MRQVSDVKAAREIQLSLRKRLIFRPPPGFAPRLAAGADVAFDRTRNLAFAAVIVIDLDTLETVESATATREIDFPYVPGYLSFRELPVLLDAFAQLETPAELCVIDGHGYAHPRRMGLACHAGLELNLPTLGCAKSILCGKVDPPAEGRGATSPMRDATTGEEIGRALRTRTGVRPVYLSVGHLMDLDTATEFILRLTPNGRFRFPETTRRSDRLAAELKRRG